MHRKVAAALVVALALGVASCGGGQRTETVSRAQLVSRLESTCAAALRAPQPKGSTRQAVLAKAIVGELNTIRDTVGQLEISGREKADLEAYKASLSPRIDVLERIASADRADQEQAIREAHPVLEEASETARGALDRLGLRHVCN